MLYRIKGEGGKQASRTLEYISPVTPTGRHDGKVERGEVDLFKTDERGSAAATLHRISNPMI